MTLYIYFIYYWVVGCHILQFPYKRQLVSHRTRSTFSEQIHTRMTLGGLDEVPSEQTLGPFQPFLCIR